MGTSAHYIYINYVHHNREQQKYTTTILFSLPIR